jgi:lysozyme
MTDDDDALIARLIRHEGLRLKPYRDTAGKLTIGVGRNLDDVGLSWAEAMGLLDNDIAAARQSLDQRWPWWRKLDPVRGGAMIELVFNLGAGGLAAFTTVLMRVEAGAFSSAADDLLATKWARQVGGRAQELAGMIRTGTAS